MKTRFNWESRVLPNIKFSLCEIQFLNFSSPRRTKAVINGVYSLKWRLTDRYLRWGTLAHPRLGRVEADQCKSSELPAWTAHLGFPALLGVPHLFAREIMMNRRHCIYHKGEFWKSFQNKTYYPFSAFQKVRVWENVCKISKFYCQNCNWRKDTFEGMSQGRI